MCSSRAQELAHMKSLVRVALGAALTILLLGVAACSATGTATPPPTFRPSPPATVPAATATPTPSIPVKTYFSKHPDSDTNPSKVFPVDRTAHSLAVATSATQQLLAGPTPA